MSRMLVQPVGQKRLTNVAVVRLKKHGLRFEIACFKNQVLSWRSGVEKSIDEVLQSHIVYSNVSKGVLSKSKDLVMAFGTYDQSKICIEILNKGELQVSGKERESLLSSQFRDIATIVMHKTYNIETKRPYTISMIERLMHDIHFAVDPHRNSKKQALEVIRELQKHYPIKRSPMRLRFTTSQEQHPFLIDQLGIWNAESISKDETGNQVSVTCEVDPSLFKECGLFARRLQGKMDIVLVSVHAEGDDTYVDDLDEDLDETRPDHHPVPDGRGATESAPRDAPVKTGSRCTTCEADVDGSRQEYREHAKSDWHKHNLRRRTRQLPPLPLDECMNDLAIHGDSSSDLKDYSF